MYDDHTLCVCVSRERDRYIYRNEKCEALSI